MLPVLQSSDNQIHMNETDIPKIAFRTHEGLMHSNYCLSEYQNALARFQPLINQEVSILSMSMGEGEFLVFESPGL